MNSGTYANIILNKLKKCNLTAPHVSIEEKETNLKIEIVES